MAGDIWNSQVSGTYQLHRRSSEKSVMVLAYESGVLDGFSNDVVNVRLGAYYANPILMML